MPDDTTKKQPSITVTLDPKYHELVLTSAEEDERTPAKWLKRFIQDAIDHLPKEGA